MTLNPSIGNMYEFLNDYPTKDANRGYTWNPIKGECPHNCIYCYMKIWKTIGKLRLVDKELKTDLGKDNYIFIGSSTDMWANDVPTEWIDKVLERCREFDNKYLFQSKNPKRFYEFLDKLPEKVVLGTTIESNRDYNLGKVLSPVGRKMAMVGLGISYEKTISIEPICDFDITEFTNWIKDINPSFVSIGADSKGHNLIEPDKEKIEKLIKNLERFTEVKSKSNLKRLMK